jgi:hypothetical protein
MDIHIYGDVCIHNHVCVCVCVCVYSHVCIHMYGVRPEEIKAEVVYHERVLGHGSFETPDNSTLLNRTHEILSLTVQLPASCLWQGAR